jgi:hypothetical protein
MKNIKSYGVTELSANEAKETNGGFVWLAFLAGFLLVAWAMDGAFD